MKKLSVRKRVENGARWLDENFPGWEDRINIDTLDLSNGQRCICGQVFAKNAKKSRARADGFDYAVSNLFSEANSWITTLVGMDPISRRSTKEEMMERATAVGRILGFDLMEDEYGGFGVLGPWSNLQKEWKRLLRARAKANAA